MDNSGFIQEKKNGIIYLACGKYHDGNHRYISHMLKNGDAEAIEYAAEQMARIIPFKNVALVPIPSHTGRATHTLELAKAISRRTHIPVSDILRGKERETLYQVKKDGRKLSDEEFGFRRFGKVPSGLVPILIDNTVDYGITSQAAIRTLGEGLVLSYSITTNLHRNTVRTRGSTKDPVADVKRESMCR